MEELVGVTNLIYIGGNNIIDQGELIYYIGGIYIQYIGGNWLGGRYPKSLYYGTNIPEDQFKKTMEQQLSIVFL